MRKHKDYLEYIGQQFGELTILSVSEPIKEKKYERHCRCKCSCGKEIETWFRSVLRGSTKSCGHVRSMRMRKDYSDYIGKQFGELTILSISEPGENKNPLRYCKCKCSCGKETRTQFHGVLNGNTKSCGHLSRERAIETHSEKLKLRNERKEANISNESTGIKNISFDRNRCCYRVKIIRNKIRYSEHAYSLSEAIKIKERILQDLGELD